MNTNKWGPSGWDQLGPMANKFDRVSRSLDAKNLNTYRLLHKTHISNTENILPCKYCRESYHTYISELPMDRAIYDGELNTWMYHIHNKVNEKLRKQGYNTKPDPSLSEAKERIKEISRDYYRATGWDYIHAIAHNYAETPDALSMIKAKTHFSTLPYLMPHPELMSATLKFMKDHPVDDTLDDRNNLVLWIYLLHEHLLPVYQRLQPGVTYKKRNYSETCAYYETFRAGCGLSAGKKGPSCRLPVSSSVRSENLKKLLNATSVFK
jgi:hypothetical protein